jgi:hypothetical protein
MEIKMKKLSIWKPEPLKKDNYVTLRIWLPRLNGQSASSLEVIKAMAGYSDIVIDKTKNTRVGHASLETKNKYASWWPGEDLATANQISALLKVVKAENSELMKDKFSEGKAVNGCIDISTAVPDVLVTLYSLNVKHIEDLFDDIREEGNENIKVASDGEIKKSKTGYVLIGNKAAVRLYNFMFNNNEQGNSCCGMAYDLVQAGGINKLTGSYSHFTAQYFVLTTDNFCDYIKYAKDQELLSHPETQLFSRELTNEYKPAIENISNSSCTIS